MSLYSELIEAGIPTSNYYSDLYFPITDGWWYDVPFAYLPYWERLEEKSA
jgi:hypothetical protein